MKFHSNFCGHKGISYEKIQFLLKFHVEINHSYELQHEMNNRNFHINEPK